MVTARTIRSLPHELYSIKVGKQGLSAYDDKNIYHGQWHSSAKVWSLYTKEININVKKKEVYIYIFK